MRAWQRFVTDLSLGLRRQYCAERGGRVRHATFRKRCVWATASQTSNKAWGKGFVFRLSRAGYGGFDFLVLVKFV